MLLYLVKLKNVYRTKLCHKVNWMKVKGLERWLNGISFSHLSAIFQSSFKNNFMYLYFPYKLFYIALYCVYTKRSEIHWLWFCVRVYIYLFFSVILQVCWCIGFKRMNHTQKKIYHSVLNVNWKVWIGTCNWMT